VTLAALGLRGNRMNGTPVVVESQPDWFTGTTSDPDQRANLKAYANHIAAAEVKNGNQAKHFGMSGFQGTRTGRVAWGSRPDRDILQLSGDLARTHLADALSLSENVSRFDVAVTARFPTPESDLEENTYMAYAVGTKGVGMPSTARLIKSNDGGATFYLGARSSTCMLRVYNKAIESGSPQYVNCHRWELEVKQERAFDLALRANEASDVEAFSRAVVFTWADGKGVAPPWPMFGPAEYTHDFKRRSDTDRQLAWLAGQVAPTVLHLTQAGYMLQAARALGFDRERLLRLADDLARVEAERTEG